MTQVVQHTPQPRDLGGTGSGVPGRKNLGLEAWFC